MGESFRNIIGNALAVKFQKPTAEGDALSKAA
jgi:hypothetical protein